MPDDVPNDNDVRSSAQMSRFPDPQGQAAMLLVESVLHGLIARSILSVTDAIEIVHVAADVKFDIAQETNEAVEAMQASLAILNAVAESLKIDV